MPIRRRDYPKDWRVRSHFVRFVRAGGRCEQCGAVHGEPHPRTGSRTQLQTAHRWQDLSRSSLLDLVCLCHVCHHDHDARDNWRRRQYGPTGRYFGQLKLEL